MSTPTTGREVYEENGWSGCEGSAWEHLSPATREGWEFAARALTARSNADVALLIAQEIESERDRRLRPEGRQWATNPDWMAWGVGLMSDAARIARSHATPPVTVDRNVWGVRLEAATIVEEPSGPECGGGRGPWTGSRAR